MREPWLIPRWWTVEQRLAALEELIADAMPSGVVRDLAARLRLIADQRVEHSTLVAPPYRRAAADRVYAQLALAAVQRCGYHADPEGEDQYQEVEYTLAHGGDCEDLAAALVALLRLGGIRARLRWCDNPPPAPQNHVTARAWLASDWLWADASVAGALLGEDPNDAVARLRGDPRVVGGAATGPGPIEALSAGG